MLFDPRRKLKQTSARYQFFKFDKTNPTLFIIIAKFFLWRYKVQYSIIHVATFLVCSNLDLFSYEKLPRVLVSKFGMRHSNEFKTLSKDSFKKEMKKSLFNVLEN